MEVLLRDPVFRDPDSGNSCRAPYFLDAGTPPIISFCLRTLRVLPFAAMPPVPRAARARAKAKLLASTERPSPDPNTLTQPVSIVQVGE